MHYILYVLIVAGVHSESGSVTIHEYPNAETCHKAKAQIETLVRIAQNANYPYIGSVASCNPAE